MNGQIVAILESRLGVQLAELIAKRGGKPTAALERHAIDSAVFTSASQVHNLFEYARTQNKSGDLAAKLNSTLVASIGPVCTAALARFSVTAGLEARPPKLGPLLEALDAALSGRR